MAFKRTDTILRKIQGRLKDRGQRTYQTPELLEELNEVYRDICRDYLALKIDDTLVMEENVDEYELDVTVYKVWQFIRPASWTKDFILTMDPAKWEEYLRDTSLTGDYPLRGFVFANRLRVHPTPATSGDEIKLIAFGLPSYDLTEGKDPETPIDWDRCLELGVIANLTNDDSARGEYLQRCGRLSSRGVNETMQGVIVGQHWSDLGF